MVSLGCAACGDCCNPVKISPERSAELGVSDDADGRFAREHWRPVGQSMLTGHVLVECDRFDPDTKLCTAHEDRPPICRGFPFYGRPPNLAALGSGQVLDRDHGRTDLGCSYLLDLPAEWRPPGVKPLIPLEVIK